MEVKANGLSPRMRLEFLERCVQLAGCVSRAQHGRRGAQATGLTGRSKQKLVRDSSWYLGTRFR